MASMHSAMVDSPSRTGTTTEISGWVVSVRVRPRTLVAGLAAGAVGLGVGSIELGGPGLGGVRFLGRVGLVDVSGERVLGVRGGEDVLDRDVGVAGVGLGEAAAGCLDVADLLG